MGRVLGPAAYGDFGVAMGLLVWLEVSLSGGFPYAIRKFGAENSELMPSIARAGTRGQTILSLALFAIVVCLAPWIAMLLHDRQLTPLIRIAALDIPIYGFYYSYHAILNARQQFSQQARAMLAYSLVKVIAVIALVMVGLSVPGALVGNVLASVGGTLLAAVYAGRLPKSTPSYPISKLISYAGGTAALAVSVSLLIHIDLFMVKAIGRGVEDAGFYTAAGTLARAPFTVFMWVAAAALPAIARTWSTGNRQAVTDYVRQSIRFHVLLLAPATAILAGTAAPTIGMIYSARYAPAGHVLPMLVTALMLYGVINTLYNVFVATGDAKTPLTVTLALLASSTMLNLLLIPRMGIAGAALSALIASTAGSIAIIFLCNRKLGTTAIRPISFARIAAASAATYLVARHAPTNPVSLLPFYALLAIIYFALLALTRELTRADLSRLSGAISGKKR